MIVNHESEVWFVEPHAEGDRGDQRLDLVAQQLVFKCFACLIVELGVVRRNRMALLGQPRGEIITGVHREAVDDAAVLDLREDLMDHRVAFGGA